MEKLKILGYAILSGLILWLSFNYHFLWIFAFVAIVPLLHIIYTKELKWWWHMLAGFIAGLIMAAGVMIWHWSILPVDWAGIDNQLHGILLVLYVWGLSSVMGGIIGLWSLSFYLLKRNNFFDILLAPALWIIFEYVRSFAISILWAGDGALIGPHWSIAFIGYTMASSKLFLPIAAIGGVYLLGAFAIAINVLIYFSASAYLHKIDLKPHVKTAGLILLILVVVAAPYYFFTKDYETTKVALVNTYTPSFSQITQEEFIEDLTEKIEILQKIKGANKNTEVIIFPEDSRLLAGLQLTGQQQIIKDTFSETEEVLIIDSARTSNNPGKPAVLNFFYLNTATGNLVQSDKLFLVPHGEYLPYITDGLLRLSGLQEWADNFREARISDRGKDIKPAEFKDFKIGTVACSEVMSSSINRATIDYGANFVVNSASHSLFNGSKVLYDQMINMAKLRAVESNRYYLMAGNFVPSFIIDNKGNLVAETEWGTASVIHEDVKIVRKNSIYIAYGRYLTALLFIIITGIAIIQRYFPQLLTSKRQ